MILLIVLAVLRFHHIQPISSPPVNQLRAIPIRDAIMHTTKLCSDAAGLTFLPISTYLANVDDEIDFRCRVCAAAMAFEQ